MHSAVQYENPGAKAATWKQDGNHDCGWLAGVPVWIVL
jgi:hypothetical protein